MRQNLELPTRPQFYQQFIRGFVAKKRRVLGDLEICRILPEKPPVDTVLTGGFC